MSFNNIYHFLWGHLPLTKANLLILNGSLFKETGTSLVGQLSEQILGEQYYVFRRHHLTCSPLLTSLAYNASHKNNTSYTNNTMTKLQEDNEGKKL